MKVLVLLMFWTAFSLAAIAAVPVSLIVLPWYGVVPYSKNIIRAMDKVLAALLGFSGFKTLSAECGAAESCRLCSLVCRFLDVFQPGHCQEAAKKEETKNGD